MRSVLVMKPGDAGRRFCGDLEKNGVPAHLVHFWSAFEILGPENPEAVKRQLLDAASSSVPIIIVSPSAVTEIAKVIDAWPESTVFATVGEPTKKSIEKRWGKNFQFIYPVGTVLESGSEALYSLFEARGIPERVLLARGQTGREFLREHLEEKGCRVDVAVVYRRIPLETTQDQRSWLNLQETSPVVFLTSSDSVDILLKNCGEEFQDWIKESSVVTIHPRIVERLHQKGFKNISAVSSEDALIKVLETARV